MTGNWDRVLELRYPTFFFCFFLLIMQLDYNVHNTNKIPIYNRQFTVYKRIAFLHMHYSFKIISSAFNDKFL